ncbi:hypothetical protein B0H13DRAFT_1862894 [Mycena leptocephala]|nr:hypothetical protein B0H13DRAFT_1862894 [Mycena leptocephala]
MDLSCAGVIYLDSAMDVIGDDNDGGSRLLVSGSRPSLDVIMTFGPCDDDRTLDNRETAVMSTSARTDSSPLYHSSFMATLHEGVSALSTGKVPRECQRAEIAFENEPGSTKRKRTDDSGSHTTSRKRARASDGSTIVLSRPAAENHLEQPLSDEREDCLSEPYCLLSQSEKAAIIAEYVTATSNDALMRLESDVHRIRCTQLDISLLEDAGAVLRDKCKQPLIQVYKPDTIVDERYILCSLCRREVTSARNTQAAMASYSFARIPLRSYANGTWTGACPEELKGLTFLEEQCIARCRATRLCFSWKRLYPPPGPWPSLRILPPPLSALHNELLLQC